jgi:hypothetical protein
MVVIMATEWISVKDKLPEKGEIVMTYGAGVADSEYCQAYFTTAKGEPMWQELDCCGDVIHPGPTHWMKLPEPPENPL